MLTREAGDWEDKAEKKVCFWCAGQENALLLHPQEDQPGGKTLQQVDLINPTITSQISFQIAVLFPDSFVKYFFTLCHLSK